jgi:uncharacterized protein (DUF924 family)
MENIDTIHEFWFARPAREPAALLAKFRRWYQGGAELDAKIRARFSSLIERALSGQLAEWQSGPRGRLALILLLDQFTRNAFRGMARAYAGDAAALELALPMLEDDVYRALDLEQRLFCVMPLLHSESLALHDRAVALSEAMVLDAASELRGCWQLGAQRTQYYRETIRRFGRFPHRNEILGRASSVEELAFIAEDAKRASPLPAANASAPA